MPKVAPFYSKQTGCKVYHNNSECKDGKSIETKYLVKGTIGNRELCHHCARLNKHGK